MNTANIYLEPHQEIPGMLHTDPNLPFELVVLVNTRLGDRKAVYVKTAGSKLGERLYRFSRFVEEGEAA